MVAGTSVGALNGAMIVQGDIEKAYDIWCDLNPQTIIKFAEDELLAILTADSAPRRSKYSLKS